MLAEKQIVVAKTMPKSPIRLAIRESSQGPTSKYARFTCDKCTGMSFVTIPADATAGERSTLMKAAVDEHRFLCPKGLAEDMRVYRIEYPRD